jgi:ribonuclease III
MSGMNMDTPVNQDLPGRKSESPAKLAKRLDIPMKDLSLLKQALTHRSYLNEHHTERYDNERLEFLGDAVMNFITGAWLYERYPDLAEGELTRLRSVIVRTEQLASIARGFNIGAAMRLGKGEDMAGGRDKDVLLCATLEAMVGAIYIQSGINAVKKFIQPGIEMADKQLKDPFDTLDPKSRLQQWSQGINLGLPKYHIMAIHGPEHQRIFEIEVQVNGKTIGYGIGASKQIAESSAAQAALQNLDNHLD